MLTPTIITLVTASCSNQSSIRFNTKILKRNVIRFVPLNFHKKSSFCNERIMLTPVILPNDITMFTPVNFTFWPNHYQTIRLYAIVHIMLKSVIINTDHIMFPPAIIKLVTISRSHQTSLGTDHIVLTPVIMTLVTTLCPHRNSLHTEHIIF